MAAKKPPVVIVHRNSVDGRFVTPQYVERHPRTTETERRPTNPKK